ncbi:hypothetical protein [Mesorhizobium sp. B1-1-5]|uniref:hypothetical protein n=1 Tax=Mesorhizobium sp. B1-1-5 TaxID=2589979 RepID=UPI00112DC8F8|nr:hypothetical protein [Mesorhizobium sp. B1-1-5]TPN75478.1 hypothetical protein FJ980_31545 [Mesorhizobium sp. B1-1-5]
MIDIAPENEAEVRNRDLAIAAASQAADACAELLRFAREGDGVMTGPFTTEVVEQLLDAAKMAMEVEGFEGSEERTQVYGAIVKFLEGWA